MRALRHAGHTRDKSCFDQVLVDVVGFVVSGTHRVAAPQWNNISNFGLAGLLQGLKKRQEPFLIILLSFLHDLIGALIIIEDQLGGGSRLRIQLLEQVVFGYAFENLLIVRKVFDYFVHHFDPWIIVSLR